jgi:hypothetical protein
MKLHRAMPGPAAARKAAAIVILLAPALLGACAVPPSGSSVPPGGGAMAWAADFRGPEISRLTGLKASELVALVGEPDFRRNDPPAQLWQYRSTGCVLDVYLYREGDGYRVARVESRDRSLAGALAGPVAGRCDDAMAPLRGHLRQSRL